MSPRPPKATDADVFAAAYRVMNRRPAGELRLADIAAEAGVTPAALVQRFGSRRGLLLRLFEAGAGWPRQLFAGLRATHRSPLRAVRGWAACLAPMGESPATLAHHLGYLQMDLADPEFHALVAAQARDTRRELRGLLRAAQRAGELATAAPLTPLTRAVEVVVTGSLISSAVAADAAVPRRVVTDLRFVLDPWMTARGRRAWGAG